MEKQLNKLVNNVIQSVRAISKKWNSIKETKIDYVGNEVKINGVYIPDIEDLEGEKYHKTTVRKKFINQYQKYFGKGRWIQNGKGVVINEDSIIMSDPVYFCMYLRTALIISKEAYRVAKEILGAEWTESIFDCDDFMRLVAGLFALIAYKKGIRGAGIGIASIKVDYYKDNKLVGHALHSLPIVENGELDWYMFEPQTADIYKISEGTEIHFFEM